MKLGFSEPQRIYDSGSQNARSMTEAWVAQSMYCPICGHMKLNQFPANLPVADFFCAKCNDQFELKSQKKAFGKIIANGAYETKLKRLESETSPNLILMNYEQIGSEIRNIILVPKRFFIPSIVKKRRPLRATARRAGWIGSNILIGNIPISGRIHLVKDCIIIEKQVVLDQWQKTAFLDHLNKTTRGWLVEVMSCVDKLEPNGFSLNQVYQFESHLSSIFPDNNNVRPKIRQQLQVLRDNGYLEFLGQGRYRKQN